MKNLKGETFISAENGSVVKVLEDTGSHVVVATVTFDGRLTNQRRMNSASLRNAARNRKTGYVRLNLKADQLPGDHEFAYRPASRQPMPVPDGDLDFSSMSDEDLAEFARRRLAEEKLAGYLANKAKEELRKREPRTGVTVLGDTAVVASRPHRFDASLAKKVLNRRQLEAISVTVPDASLAKKVLGADSPLYRSVCTEGKIRLEIRPATDEDREAAQIMDTAAQVATTNFRIGDHLPEPDWDS